jgi:hypothetical protein
MARRKDPPSSRLSDAARSREQKNTQDAGRQEQGGQALDERHEQLNAASTPPDTVQQLRDAVEAVRKAVGAAADASPGRNQQTIALWGHADYCYRELRDLAGRAGLPQLPPRPPKGEFPAVRTGNRFNRALLGWLEKLQDWSAGFVEARPGAGGPPATQERLVFDPLTCTVTLNGVPHKISDPRAFAVYQVIANACVDPVRPGPVSAAHIYLRRWRTGWCYKH